MATRGGAEVTPMSGRVARHIAWDFLGHHQIPSVLAGRGQGFPALMRIATVSTSYTAYMNSTKSKTTMSISSATSIPSAVALNRFRSMSFTTFRLRQTRQSGAR